MAHGARKGRAEHLLIQTIIVFEEIHAAHSKNAISMPQYAIHRKRRPQARR